MSNIKIGLGLRSGVQTVNDYFLDNLAGINCTKEFFDNHIRVTVQSNFPVRGSQYGLVIESAGNAWVKGKKITFKLNQYANSWVDITEKRLNKALVEIIDHAVTAEKTRVFKSTQHETWVNFKSSVWNNAPRAREAQRGGRLTVEFWDKWISPVDNIGTVRIELDLGGSPERVAALLEEIVKIAETPIPA